MIATGSIFFEIELPNATTWFYFSALLAVALFFKFNRLLSIRNADILALFLPVPGFLLLDPRAGSPFWGYLWLLIASGVFLVRCLFDLTLVRRPALSPNLNFSGLVWLAGALFVSLIAVAVRPATQSRHDNESSRQHENVPEAIDLVRRLGEKVIPEPAREEVDRKSVDVWVERGLTVLCHLAVAIGLILIGRRHFDDLHAGMAAATFYLLLPYTYLLMPWSDLGVGRLHHAWPMALMIWMVLCYRRPTLAGLFLGLAAGTVFFPALVFPLWLSFYSRRGAQRFAVAFALSAGLCLAIVGLVWLNDAVPRTLMSSWNLSAWLPWRPPAAEMAGLWAGTSSHWAYRLPIFLAYIAFAGTTAFWPAPKNLAHVLALTAALLIGIQFWYADQGGVYVLWYLPLLLLLVFRPNLSACQPQPPGRDWLAHLGRRLLIFARRSLRMLRPVRRRAPVSRLMS